MSWAFQTMIIERVTNVGEVKRGAISPDGKYLAFAAGETGKAGLGVRQVATHSDIQILPSTAGVFVGLQQANFEPRVRVEHGATPDRAAAACGRAAILKRRPDRAKYGKMNELFRLAIVN
jgi:hypothetical protein